MDSPSTPKSRLILINVQEWSLKHLQRSCGWLFGRWSPKNMSKNVPVDCLSHLPCEIAIPFLHKEMMVNPSEVGKQKNRGKIDVFSPCPVFSWEVIPYTYTPDISQSILLFFLSYCGVTYLIEKFRKNSQAFWVQEWESFFFLLLSSESTFQVFPSLQRSPLREDCSHLYW